MSFIDYVATLPSLEHLNESLNAMTTTPSQNDCASDANATTMPSKNDCASDANMTMTPLQNTPASDANAMRKLSSKPSSVDVTNETMTPPNTSYSSANANMTMPRPSKLCHDFN